MHSASISCGRRALLEKGQRRAPLFRGVVVISPRDSGTQAYPSLCGLGFWQLLWGCAALVTASVGGGAARFWQPVCAARRFWSPLWAALLAASVGCAALLTASVGCAAPLWAAFLAASVGCAALLTASVGCAALLARIALARRSLAPVRPPLPNAGEVSARTKPPLRWATRPPRLAPPRRPSWLARATPPLPRLA